MQIGICVKYCGGCNPIIDRAKLVQEIKKLLSPEFILSDGQTQEQRDIGILVCGCLTACADKPALKNSAVKWILVAGHSVDHNNVPEKELANIVLVKLRQ
ncbi:MAG: hypothetical protein ABSD50_03875 [Smithella sp.]|jgi:hypothetical protein